MFGLLCFLGEVCLPLEILAFDKNNCPERRDSLEYQHRDGNRCEGINSTKISDSTHADLVSVTLRPDDKTSQTLPSTLMIKFYKRTDIYKNRHPSSPYKKIQSETLAVREFMQNYYLDNFAPQEKEKFFTFQWPTKIIKQLNIGLNKLHGKATDAYGVFVPVVIAPPLYSGDLYYEFAILDKGKLLKFISFDISDESGNRIENIKIEPYTTLPRKDFITVKWDGMQKGKHLNPGIYSVRFTVEIKDEVRSKPKPSNKYKFLHVSDLLR